MKTIPSRSSGSGASSPASTPTLPQIQAPKGGGAIRGMGEKFAANPVTGSASMTVPLPTSPGRGGFGPGLSLTYDSGSGNGPFGLGWSLGLPSVTRKTDKGVPHYGRAPEPDVFILSGAEDLVPVLEQAQVGLIEHREVRAALGGSYEVRRYRPRVEAAFARIESWVNVDAVSDSFWRTISRDNVTTWYGRTAESRIADADEPGRIFSWLISETHDDRGNVVSYRYKAEDSVGVEAGSLHERNRTPVGRSAARYIKRILYGNRLPYRPEPVELASTVLPDDWCFELVFDYGEHDADAPAPQQESQAWPVRSDPFSTYRAGFEQRTYRLCQRVLMFHHFPAEPAVGSNCLVRSTDFSYDSNAQPTPGPGTVYTMLQSVTQAAYRRMGDAVYRRAAMPPVEFDYSQARIDEQIHDLDPMALRNTPFVDGGAYSWVDLDGEGMPGILSQQANAWFYKRNESPAAVGAEGAAPAVRFAPVRVQRTQPQPDGADSGRQLLDLSGDGRLDLVAFGGLLPGYQSRTSDGDWDEYTPFRSLPAIDWSSPNLRFVDLTGDGKADILITEHDTLRWHRSLAEGGFDAAQSSHLPLDDERGPRVVFADGTETLFLADLSGDGLTDLVRIRNGDVCYWPNLGHGRFGAKVGMDNAPWFDDPQAFDPHRLQLADIDGSGTTDIVYFGRDGARVYFNQSGNAWSMVHPVSQFPVVDTLAYAAVVDLLGNGTACLVWSSTLAAEQHRSTRYIDLMGGTKPHLLVASRNNLGAETRVGYAPSTRFYVQDRDAGTPWITRLPFPVHVVERVETIDHIGRNRFVSRFRYRHGYFDGFEREFRGFGRVDQWDTEEIGALQASGPPATNLDAASHVPPVHTRSWYHVGAYLDGIAISRQFADEYYRPPGEPAHQADLPDSVLPPGLTLDEAREASRALKGMMLRQEVYTDDGTALAPHPYTVTEQNSAVVLLQGRHATRHAAFMVHPRESLVFHHERDPADPRIAHQFTLAVDEFGNVLRSATVAYGRRQSDLDLAEDRRQQTRLLATCDETGFTNAVDAPDAHRVPLPASARSFELTGLELPAGARRFTLAQIDAAAGQAPEVPFESVENGALQRRLLSHVRTLYRPDDLGLSNDDPMALLPAGQMQARALAGLSLQLAFTAGLVTQTLGDRVDSVVLAEGGYLADDSGTGWWSPSDRTFFSPGQADTAAQELDFARRHFFQPQRAVDPFGNAASVAFDVDDLFPVESIDALGNTHRASIDYRVLQPWRTVDPNGNRSELAFDTLGLVVGTAVMGKVSENLGDSLEGFVADLDPAATSAYFDNPRAQAGVLLQGASTRLAYDLFAYHRTRGDAQPAPPAVSSLVRETHLSDLAPGQSTRLQLAFSYSDGFGREVQKKVQAEAGPVPLRGDDGRILVGTNGHPLMGADATSPRWVGTGWTIFNNKGKPVRQFEPFFTDTHRQEFDVRIGVSPIVFYDPAERVVGTLHPNHSWEKVAFSAWQQTTWDVNDTVLHADPRNDEHLGSYFLRLDAADYLPTWHAQRIGGQFGEGAARQQAERRAAQKAAAHADTPSVAHFDVLGPALPDLGSQRPRPRAARRGTSLRHPCRA